MTAQDPWNNRPHVHSNNVRLGLQHSSDNCLRMFAVGDFLQIWPSTIPPLPPHMQLSHKSGRRSAPTSDVYADHLTCCGLSGGEALPCPGGRRKRLSRSASAAHCTGNSDSSVGEMTWKGKGQRLRRRGGSMRGERDKPSQPSADMPSRVFQPQPSSQLHQGLQQTLPRVEKLPS